MNWLFAVAVTLLIGGSVGWAQAPAASSVPPGGPGIRAVFGDTNSVRQPTLAEMERAYLDGKIKAREYQRFLRTYRAPPGTALPAAPATNELHTRAIEVLRKATPNAAANPEGPAIREPLPEPPEAIAAGTNEVARAAAIQDVESKLDELIRKKEARETGTNIIANSTNAPMPEFKTKRERLDYVLKLYIDGKLSDTEYKERRARILLGPD